MSFSRASSFVSLPSRIMITNSGKEQKAVRPEFDRNRVEGLITEVVGKEVVPAFGNTLVQQVENVSMAAVDDSVKANANAHYRAGAESQD